MRLTSITVNNTPPVTRFSVTDLADVVVIAGPNGVGKTRLLQRIMQLLRGDAGSADAVAIIEATGDEEPTSWGKNVLNLALPDDAQLYRATLQANRRRRNLRSSILQFESDRTIQNLRPFAFGWDMADPSDEEVGWETGFGFWKNRWQDTVDSLYRLIEHQKQSIANRAVQLQREGHAQMNLNFTDPMLPFKAVFSQLLAPKELVDPSARRQALEFSLDGQVFDIAALSSGEREVVNVAFDFLLREPRDCMVFFDEPELHLHPELSHKLIQVLQGIGERNQFILSTHSPDVITASLDKSVIFLSPPRLEADNASPANQAIPVSEDDETNQALKLLGHSIGIVALGKRIVLIEGEHSSLDKDVYGSMTRGRYPQLVLVPSGGKHVVQSFETLHEAVLSKSIWGVEFFMLCDRDSAPTGQRPPDEAGNDRLRVLSRYHLENYFLDELTWARAFATLESPDHWLRDPTAVRARFRELARGLASYATALAVTAQLRQQVGNVDVMPKDCHERSLDDVIALLSARAAEEQSRTAEALNPVQIAAQATEFHTRLSASLDADTDDWKVILPGKPLLQMFASAAGIHPGRMKNLYLSAAAGQSDGPFEEIDNIFRSFAEM
ncbi:MAG: AAA family ATPase [Dehalococcoidia bacterium]